MSDGIEKIHDKLCQAEGKFGVIFNRETAVSKTLEDINYTMYHLTVDHYVETNYTTDKQILATLAVLDDQDNVKIHPVAVLVDPDDHSLTKLYILDADAKITAPPLQETDKFFDQPVTGLKETDAGQTGSEPSLKNVTITVETKNDGSKVVTCTGTIDVSLFYGLITLDVMQFNYSYTV